MQTNAYRLQREDYIVYVTLTPRRKTLLPRINLVDNEWEAAFHRSWEIGEFLLY